MNYFPRLKGEASETGFKIEDLNSKIILQTSKFRKTKLPQLYKFKQKVEIIGAIIFLACLIVPVIKALPSVLCLLLSAGTLVVLVTIEFLYKKLSEQCKEWHAVEHKLINLLNSLFDSSRTIEEIEKEINLERLKNTSMVYISTLAFFWPGVCERDNEWLKEPSLNKLEEGVQIGQLYIKCLKNIKAPNFTTSFSLFPARESFAGWKKNKNA